MNKAIALLLAAAATAAAAPGFAQSDYPSRPIKLIAPYAPGGSVDVLARTLATHLSTELKQSVVVENRPGANTMIAASAVARSPADGYTLLLASNASMVLNPLLYKKLSYNPDRELKLTNILAEAPLVLVTNSLPVKTVGELIAYAKAHPGKLNYATSGNGTIVHLNTAAFSAQAGVEMTHIPYKGTALAIPDLIAGQTHVLFDSLPTGMPHAKAGRLRALAVTSEKRSTLAPELPTLAESGLPGYSSVTWFGVYLPAGAPPALVDRVHKAFAKAVQAPEVAESLAKLGVEPAAPRTPAQFGAMVQADSNRWATVIRQHKISIE